MHHHHSQQQGPPQLPSNMSTHHQQQPNQQQQQDRFKYPPPNHLPDELVSAMATVDLMNRPNMNQDVPRFHSVLQTAGKVIDYSHLDYGHLDYGHLDYAHLSATADDSSVGESMPEGRHARLQPFEPNEYVDLDYCRSSGEVQKNKQLSPVGKGASFQERSAIGGEDSGNGPELEKETSEEEFSLRSTVLITGLPEGGRTERDVIKLCKPFGAPTDIILATQLGKVLLSMPDAQMVEMVKNHSVAPMKINDSELKMSNLEESISLNTPVALYNLLNPSIDTVNVHWNRLLVIRHVPNTPSAPSEVQTLVERIGKVHNTLVLLNRSMIICEMSVRGVMSIQGNRLYFESRPDKKCHVWGPRWLPPWRTASLDSFKESPDDDKDNPTVPTANKEDSILEENGKCGYLVELCHEGTVFAIYCKLCDSRIKSAGVLSIDPKHIKAHLKRKRHKKLSILYKTYTKGRNSHFL